jgi:RNA polymerase-binding transcription factor DksA
VKKIRTPASRRRRPAAATSDVVSKRKIIRGKWKDQYQRLAELRDRFLIKREALSRDAKEEQPAYSLHTADAGTDNYDRDWALSMLSQEQDALYEIEEAMSRIRKGTYGVCELTGKPIPKARLQAIPWTRFSVEAETQLEDAGKIKRTHLGERRSVLEPETAEAESE